MTVAPNLLFGRFLYALRRAGLPVGTTEWMGLMRALSEGFVAPSLEDFYVVARALLIKSETQFDTFDQVFASVFGEGIAPPDLEKVLQWVAEAQSEFTALRDVLDRLPELPLEELRRQFEERLREQTERHDGGSRWVGTGGRSPFGHSGAHSAGVRVGGHGGGRSAVQVASERRFAAYRSDRILDSRGISVALKKLRRLSRREGDPELDVDQTIEATGKNGGELSIVFTPPRTNQAKVVLLMDVGGSMDPYTAQVERLFTAASRLDHWKRFTAYAFHNCVYERLERLGADPGPVPTADVLSEQAEDSFLVVVGDAFMAPTELFERFGAIEYRHLNQTPGVEWLHRLRRRFARSVWLNPLPPRGWGGYTVQAVRRLFPMFPLTLAGLDDAVRALTRGSAPPVPDLPMVFPELGQFSRRAF